MTEMREEPIKICISLIKTTLVNLSKKKKKKERKKKEKVVVGSALSLGRLQLT